MRTLPLFFGATLAALIVGLPAPPARAADGFRYCNARFGQCADIPAGFRSDPPPENGDGLIFRDAGGMSITASAMYNVAPDTVASERASDIQLEGAPTYQAEGANWFVISGLKGANVYYIKCFVKPSTISSLWIEYPAARKAAYGAIVARIAKSFTPAE